MGRQGVKRTTKAVLLAGVIVALPIGLALVLRLRGVHDLAPLAGFGTMSIDSRWIPLAVLLSAASSWGVSQNYGFKSGGFVGAAYVGMFMGDPYQVAVAITIALITYVLVKYVLMNVLILFGRRKFSAMLLTSSMLSWTLLWVGPSFLSSRVTNHLDLASMALTPLFVPGLLANDMDRTGPLRVMAGAGLAAAFVVPSTWWIQSLVEGRPLALLWMGLALATFVAIFWKTMRQLYRYYRPAKVAEEIEDDHSSDVSADLDTEFEELVHAAAQHGWPEIERRRAGRPWSDRPAVRVPDDLSKLDWTELVPNVYSIDSTGWSLKGNQRWQVAHPDAWEDADRWLEEALSSRERDSRVA